MKLRLVVLSIALLLIGILTFRSTDKSAVEPENYDDLKVRAVKAAQRMVDLRPDSSSYARVSYRRSLHGDTECN